MSESGTEVKTTVESATAARDISGWWLLGALVALFALAETMRGFPSTATVEGIVQVLAHDLGMMAAPFLFGWIIAAIPHILAKHAGKPPTAINRNTLIWGVAMTAVAIVGSRVEPQRQPAPDAMGETAAITNRAIDPTPAPLPAPAPPAASTLSAPVAEPPAAAPVNLPTPWEQIANYPQYLQATEAERAAIRELYWVVCIEALIAPSQRHEGRAAFDSDAAATEATLPTAPPEKPMSVPEYLRRKREGTAAPMTAQTMAQWCRP